MDIGTKLEAIENIKNAGWNFYYDPENIIERKVNKQIKDTGITGLCLKVLKDKLIAKLTRSRLTLMLDNIKRIESEEVIQSVRAVRII
jgi:hypothetical protein